MKSTPVGTITVEISRELIALLDKIAKARKTTRNSLVRNLVIDGLAALALPADPVKTSAVPSHHAQIAPGTQTSRTELAKIVQQAQFILSGEGDLLDPEIRKLAVEQEIVEHGIYEHDKGWTYRGRFVPVTPSTTKRHNCRLDDLGSEFK